MSKWVECKELFLQICTDGDLEPLRRHLQGGGNPNIHSDGYSLLCDAARSTNAELVELLLAHGADPDAAGEGLPHFPPLVAAAVQGNATIVDMLLGSQCNVNATDVQGDTALLRAVQNNDVSLVQKLIRAGADPTIANLGGSSPLMPRHDGHINAAQQFLLESGFTLDRNEVCNETNDVLPTKFETWKEAVRSIGVCAPNYGLSTEQIISELEEWDNMLGIEVTSPGIDRLCVSFDSIGDSASDLALRVSRFCPDVLSQGFDCIPEMIDSHGDSCSKEVRSLVHGIDLDDPEVGLLLLAKSLEQSRSVTLWWD